MEVAREPMPVAKEAIAGVRPPQNGEAMLARCSPCLRECAQNLPFRSSNSMTRLTSTHDSSSTSLCRQRSTASISRDPAAPAPKSRRKRETSAGLCSLARSTIGRP